MRIKIVAYYSSFQALSNGCVLFYLSHHWGHTRPKTKTKPHFLLKTFLQKSGYCKFIGLLLENGERYEDQNCSIWFPVLSSFERWVSCCIWATTKITRGQKLKLNPIFCSKDFLQKSGYCNFIGVLLDNGERYEDQNCSILFPVSISFERLSLVLFEPQLRSHEAKN